MLLLMIQDKFQKLCYYLLLIVVILAIAGIIGIFIVRRIRNNKKTGNKNIESGHKGGDTGNDGENNKGSIDDIESLLGEEGSNFKENFQKK